MKKIFIFGKGTFAELAKFYFDNDSDYEVCGFIVDSQYIGQGESTHLGLPLANAECMLEMYPPEEYSAFVAIGYSNMNRNRQTKIDELNRNGYNLVTYIASSCSYWKDAYIGKNCMIMENVVLQPFVEIGDGCIICSGANISHNSLIGANTYISSNAVIAGQVHIGCNSFIGVGAAIKNNITVSEFTLIGAGTYIAHNTKPYGVYGRNGTVDVLKNIQDSDRKKFQAFYL